MNKYIFARTYLRALFVLAILVALVGLVFVCGQLGRIATDVKAYQKAKNTPLTIEVPENVPLTIDTKNLVDELKYASVVVGSFAIQHRASMAPPGISGDDFVAELKKRNIEISEAVQLGPTQVDDLEPCLQVARNVSKNCKAELLKEFLATLNDIATPVRYLLNAESGTAAVKSGATVGGRNLAQDQAGPSQQLFGSESLAEMQFDDLNAAVSFLRKGPQTDIVTYISPQAGMRTAADELEALLQLIRADLQRLQKERQPHLTDEELAASTAATTSTKAEVLRRFLYNLSLCEQLAKVNISRKWVVDAQIEKAENELTSFRAEQSRRAIEQSKRLADLRNEQRERLAYLLSDMSHCAMLTVVAVLLTAIGALMLLIVRDFFSALIDTAVNTAATANTLDRMRRGDATGSAE